ncbi:hypothetical protein P885DRAFT_40560 [Corynascus similis CBS 632.67]
MPIILAGKAEPVAEKAISDMKPELDVVHFIFINDARREIPMLTRGEIPSPRNPHGSDDWSTRPKAIVYAAVYRDRDIDMYRKLTTEAAGTDANNLLPWLRVDTSIPAPPVGPELVKALTLRAKNMLKKLDEEGKLVPGGAVDYYY